MTSPLLRLVRSLLERWMQRGLLHQLVLMAAAVAGVAATGGLTAFLATDDFEHLGGAVWWAFLRLTDPGYLGDDEGAVLRVISTAVTVAGYVLFMGSLIAILTQWLTRQMRQLESGLTPIAMRGHVVVLGWTNRTPEVVLKLMTARGRLQRFLEHADARRLNVVIQAAEVDAELRLILREHLGQHWDDRRVHLRTGSSLHPDDLLRLDVTRAATVVVPGADFAEGGAEGSDTRVVKALLTLDGLFRDLPAGHRPSVVAEVFDPQKAGLARRAAGERVEVLPGSTLIARLVTQITRHPGLAPVLDLLFSHTEGQSIYVKAFPELVGHTPLALRARFTEALVLGCVRSREGRHRAELDLAVAGPLQEGDSLVLLAEAFDRCVPRAGSSGAHDEEPKVRPGAVRPAHSSDHAQRVLVLGWSHKLGALVQELDRCRGRGFALTVLSRTPAEERVRWLARVPWDPRRVSVEHLEGDHALAADLARLDLAGFDDVWMLASDMAANSEEADARTILGRVQLAELLEPLSRRPRVLVELLDPDNQRLFREEGDVTLVTPAKLSFLLAHVAFRPELACVYDEILRSGGQELELWTVEQLVHGSHFSGERDLPHSLVQAAALAHRATALGLLLETEGPAPRLLLAPRTTHQVPVHGTKVVLLRTVGG